ncbi:porin [Ramlibacter sp.]|uniref:porin n=1 Tax=Ramlibacter sp. TaxID=1917967 RepID=UPI002637E18C|nr:porin [Ramlibacter sp.]MDB5954166.1 putative outer rane porin protein precursor [Ramlibacter sp.]
MKKSLIALAVMAAAGAASAQSSVTLFGIVDATISHYNAGGQHNTILTNSGYNSSRLGFRGTEDLGGGLAASFWLEAGLNNDNGSNGTTNTNNTLGGSTGGGGLTFGRRSTVSLSGGWGEVRLGRDYVPTFWNTTLFDPFGTNGVGTTIVQKAKTTTLATTLVPFATLAAPTQIAAQDPNAVRASNMIQYFLPANLGGIYGQASYAPSEVANGGRAGRFAGARLGYGAGPFNVAAAYGRTSGSGALLAGAAALQTMPDVSDWNIGGQWDFGMARLMAEYDRTKFSNGFGITPNSSLKGWLIGASVPVGPGEIRASYSREKQDVAAFSPRSSQWAVGYVHNLSKRTALYATYARLNNRGGADLAIDASLPQATAVNGGVNGNSSGLDLGIRHSF